MIDDLIRLDELSPAERRALSAKLDRITARFAYVVIGLVAVMAVYHLIRWIAS